MANTLTAVNPGTLGWMSKIGDGVPEGPEIHCFGWFDVVGTGITSATGRSCPPLPSGRGFTKQYSPIVPKGWR